MNSEWITNSHGRPYEPHRQSLCDDVDDPLLGVGSHRGRDLVAVMNTNQQTNVVPLHREPMSAERTYIENKIREHERAIADHAQKIRWLRLELETV